MIATPHSQRFFVLFGTIALLLAGLVSTSDAADESAPADDGWRRTASGWEHISTWNLPPAPVPAHIASHTPIISAAWSNSLLSHPAVVSLVLMVMAWGALTSPLTRFAAQPLAMES